MQESSQWAGFCTGFLQVSCLDPAWIPPILPAPPKILAVPKPEFNWSKTQIHKKRGVSGINSFAELDHSKLCGSENSGPTLLSAR